VLGLGLRLRVGGRHVDLPRHAPLLQQSGDVVLGLSGLARRRNVRLAVGRELLLGVAAQDGVEHRPAAGGRALDALLAAAYLVERRVRLLERLGHHTRVADREEAPPVRERLPLRPPPGGDLPPLLQAVAGLLLWHRVAAGLPPANAAGEP